MVSAPDLHSGGLQVQVLYRPLFINMHILEHTNRFRRIERRFNSSISDLLYQMHWAEDMKHKDIALMLNIPRATLTKWFLRLKVPTQSCRRFTDKNLTSWLYKTGKLKKKPRYEGPDRRIQRTKGGLNVDFFKKWSPEMAYVLGYFAADGCMYKNSGGSKYFNFVSTDYELLKKVKDMLGSKHKIVPKIQHNPNCKPAFWLQIGSKEMYNDLVNLGVTRNKQFTMSLPRVPRRYLRDFVRGNFDGDGCVSVGYYPRKDRKGKNTFVFRVIFVCGSRRFLKALSHRLSSCINIGAGYLGKKQSNSYRLVYSTQVAIKLFDYMYRGVDKSRYLERKYNKFQEALRIIGAVA